jgi:hypothetical protein
MRCIAVYLVAATTLALVSPMTAQAQMKLTDNLASDPNEAEFVYEDIHNFVRAFQLLAGGGDSVAILQAEYFDEGSLGLGAFVFRYDLTAERLVRAIREHPEAYAAVGSKLEALAGEVPRYRAAYAEIKRLIPDAAFPPTYFLIGAHRGIGSGSEEGPLVTIEGESVEDIQGKFVTMLVHEMVHMEQVQATGLDKYRAIFGPEKSLLALTIREGIAEYYAHQITGRMTQERARPFVLEHERELWERFQPEMLGTETGDWMWSRPADPEQPPHIAYVMGARITEAYFANVEDRDRATREVLSVVDYPAFLERSGYGEWIGTVTLGN